MEAGSRPGLSHWVLGPSSRCLHRPGLRLRESLSRTSHPLAKDTGLEGECELVGCSLGHRTQAPLAKASHQVCLPARSREPLPSIRSPATTYLNSLLILEKSQLYLEE